MRSLLIMGSLHKTQVAGKLQKKEKEGKKGKKKKWAQKTKDHFEKELKKLQRMNPQVGEYGVQRTYVETLLDLPWNEFTEDQFNLKKAERILNKDHYGLEKVKNRILEYLAVLQLKGDMRSPIICLHCLLYTSPSPRDRQKSRMPSSA